MSNESDFAVHESAIRALNPKDLKYLTMPPGVYSQESEDLEVWARADLATLTAKGFEAALLDQLKTRTGAFRHIQSHWNATRFTKEDAQKQFALLAPAAYDLRARLVHDMLFAYRKHEDLKGRVQAIAEGSGDADMIQDLSDFAVLGKKHKEPLAAVGFDMALLDEAAAKSQELSSLLASSRGEKTVDSGAKLLRDQAYTYLKEVVDEVREFGQYVFWRDPARLPGYGSAFNRRMRNKSAAAADTAAVSDAP
jgi:hypothetical protein